MRGVPLPRTDCRVFIHTFAHVEFCKRIEVIKPHCCRKQSVVNNLSWFLINFFCIFKSEEK